MMIKNLLEEWLSSNGLRVKLFEETDSFYRLDISYNQCNTIYFDIDIINNKIYIDNEYETLPTNAFNIEDPCFFEKALKAIDDCTITKHRSV